MYTVYPYLKFSKVNFVVLVWSLWRIKFTNPCLNTKHRCKTNMFKSARTALGCILYILFFVRGYQGYPSSALSKMLFICTANDINAIPKSLRDRMKLIDVSWYVSEKKSVIAKHYLILQGHMSTGFKEEQVNEKHTSTIYMYIHYSILFICVHLKIEVADENLSTLTKLYCRECSVRNVQKHIKKVFIFYWFITQTLLHSNSIVFLINGNSNFFFKNNIFYLLLTY